MSPPPSAVWCTHRFVGGVVAHSACGPRLTSRVQVKCGTLSRLVERLTYENFPDMEYVQAFMLTYRSFAMVCSCAAVDVASVLLTSVCALTANGASRAVDCTLVHCCARSPRR